MATIIGRIPDDFCAYHTQQYNFTIPEIGKHFIGEESWLAGQLVISLFRKENGRYPETFREEEKFASTKKVSNMFIGASWKSIRRQIKKHNYTNEYPFIWEKKVSKK